MKLWGGRFTGATDPVMERFNNSLSVDRVLCQVDLQGSEAYASALTQCGLLTAHERDEIHRGLALIAQEWASNAFVTLSSDEDIHTANERRLGEIIGAATAGKLHTGRSRNDQVVTDLRLWLLREIESEILPRLVRTIDVGCTHAEREIDTLMAGLTHLQPAQPVRYSHWLMSHVVPLLRDCERLRETARRVAVCPLGSGALAGHAFDIDRHALALSLGFSSPSLNSIDATSERDFVLEALQWATQFMLHCSQLAEDLILLSSARCVALSDAYCTGSSLMPQKKNPDALELLRGKTGRVLGHCTSLSVTLKGLPRAYNKDLQEDKVPLFDAFSTVRDCLDILLGVLSTTTVNAEKMRERLTPDLLATDLAEYLVRKGVPFRETHHIAGAAVKLAEERNIPLNELSVADLQGLHALFAEDVVEVWSYENSVEKKNSFGGTARERVLEQIAIVRQRITALSVA